MDLKVIDNFLSPTIFNRLLKIVESHMIEWVWSNNTHYDPSTKKGDNCWMFSQFLYAAPSLPGGPGSHPLYPAFHVIEDCQFDIRPFKQVLKLKLNLYPNQGKNISHAKHADIYDKTGGPDECIITSVFNFHTCNGSTVVGEKNIDSKANRLILFDNTIHYGITQSDLPRRIVLNINALK